MMSATHYHICQIKERKGRENSEHWEIVAVEAISEREDAKTWFDKWTEENAAPNECFALIDNAHGFGLHGYWPTQKELVAPRDYVLEFRYDTGPGTMKREGERKLEAENDRDALQQAVLTDRVFWCWAVTDWWLFRCEGNQRIMIASGRGPANCNSVSGEHYGCIGDTLGGWTLDPAMQENEEAPATSP